MIKLMFAFALALAAACGGKTQPPPSDPAAVQSTEPATQTGSTDSVAMTPDECTAKGGQVKGDIGDGKVACDADQRDLGRVNQGIEGAVCCAPQQAP
ncbi:MAG: hypothetical protein AB7P03_07280 [Kofleriaceae bacterium]